MADEKQEKYNYSAIIPWYILKSHLERLERKATAKMRGATTHEDMLRCQGELVLLDKLKNLPETLTLIEEEENG